MFFNLVNSPIFSKIIRFHRKLFILFYRSLIFQQSLSDFLISIAWRNQSKSGGRQLKKNRFIFGKLMHRFQNDVYSYQAKIIGALLQKRGIKMYGWKTFAILGRMISFLNAIFTGLRILDFHDTLNLYFMSLALQMMSKIFLLLLWRIFIHY